MTKLVKKRAKKAGTSPGTLVHIGRPRSGATLLEVLEYDAVHLKRRTGRRLSELLPLQPPPAVAWINMEGVAEVELLQEFGDRFGIHPLVLEDIVATDQRPKAEDYAEYLYVVLKMLTLDQESGEIKSEQVSLVLKEGLLLSFQEGLDGDVFQPVRQRLANPAGRLRAKGADYLLYALMDVIVDNYFLVLEALAERIENLEDEVVGKPTGATLHEINRLKREMLFLHKLVWPLRETVGALQRRDSELIADATVIYLRDLYDHTVQVLDTLETLRDMLTGLLDIYLSSISNRLNMVMKVLTIISTLFLPLTFIVGLYGMNFKYMPELEWHYGYPAVLIAMGGIAAAMLRYFRKKEWL